MIILPTLKSRAGLSWQHRHGLLRRLDHPADLTRRAGIVSAKQQATLASKASLVYTLATDCEAKAPSEAIGAAVAAWLVTNDKEVSFAALAQPTYKSGGTGVYALQAAYKRRCCCCSIFGFEKQQAV